MAVRQEFAEFEPGGGRGKIANAQSVKEVRNQPDQNAFRAWPQGISGKGRPEDDCDQTRSEQPQQGQQNCQSQETTPLPQKGVWLEEIS